MRKGFTLIELLVVISIIGIIASIVVVSVNEARAKSEDAQRIANAREIIKVLNAIETELGDFPDPVQLGCPNTPFYGSYCLGLPTGQTCNTGQGCDQLNDLLLSKMPYIPTYETDVSPIDGFVYQHQTSVALFTPFPKSTFTLTKALTWGLEIDDYQYGDIVSGICTIIQPQTGKQGCLYTLEKEEWVQ